MPTKKSIEWEVYKSPLEENNQQELDEDDIPDYDDGYDSIINMPKVGQQGKWLFTPAGMIPLPSNIDVHDNFQLWTMHCNFDLNEEALQLLEEVPGVELVHIFSRYRAIIGIGKHSSFNSVEVRLQIEKALCKSDEPVVDVKANLSAKVDALKKKFIKSGSKDWFIFVLPNSTVTGYNNIGADDATYQKYLEFARTMNKQINGILYESKEGNNINENPT